MQKHLFIAAAFVLSVLSGCSKLAGDPVTKEFSIDGSYTELQVHDAMAVTVSDAVDKITITAGEGIMRKIIVQKNGNELTIRLKRFTSNYGSQIKVILPYNPDLKDVDLSGASNFRTGFTLKGRKVEVDCSGASGFYGDIEADEIDLDLSGASTIIGKVSATDLDLELSGASTATLEGPTGKLDLQLSGASTLIQKVAGDQYALNCEQCKGSLSGASTAYLHCDGSIRVALSGSSVLHYTGNASTSACSTSGSSSVVHDVK